MKTIEQRKSELNAVMSEFGISAQQAWTKIAMLEGDKTLRPNEKIAKIKDIIMQEVAKNDN